MTKTIISCAITGSIHTPSMSPYLPWKPEDIATQAIDAAQAGAAILHLHARDPHNGHPSGDPEHFRAFLPQIGQGCDAVINLTTGGNAIMTLEERLAAALTFRPEMCSLNMGSMNFALYPMADKPRDWLFDWEEPFLRNTDDLVFKNTPRDIAGVLQQMGQERGARFEFECYDISHLYMLRHFVDRGLVQAPDLYPVCLWRIGRYGRGSRYAGPYDRHGGQAAGQGLYVLGPRCGAASGAHGDPRGPSGWACARRA